MQPNLPIFLILFLVLIIYLVKMRTPRRLKPGALQALGASENNTIKSNDKLILVSGTDFQTLKAVLLSFAALYNKEKQQVQMQLTSLNEKEFAITFPNDIEFEYFCFCINFLVYPIGSEMEADVRGWATDPVRKTEAMYYIPKEDEEHDNVYLTLADNRYYKIDFSFSEDRKLLPQTMQPYQMPDVHLDYVMQLKGEMII